MTAGPDIDPALVRAAQRGDRMAMGALMDVLVPYVGRLCGPIALQDGPDAAQEALIAIIRALGRLREPAAIRGWAHRAVLVLRDLEGLDEQAAAAVLDVPLGTVRSRLSRARRTFRKAWEQ